MRLEKFFLVGRKSLGGGPYEGHAVFWYFSMQELGYFCVLALG